MKSRMRLKIYVGLLVAAVAVVAAGTAMLLTRPRAFDIPASPAVVSAQAYWHMSGYRETILVFGDGRVRCTVEQGLRVPSPRHPATQIWKIGRIPTSEVDQLVSLIATPQFSDLTGAYSYNGNPSSDLWFKLVTEYNGMQKTVQANSFASPDAGNTYPEMPHPLDDIYAQLHSIVQNETRQVAKQLIYE